MRVLLIDDDAQLNRLTVFALRSRGISVVSTTIPDEGLRLAVAEDFDLVLLDVMMPGLDGPAVLQTLRATERTRSVPVIFISASDSLLDAAMRQQPGVRGVIRKPFDPASIAGEILSLLGRAAPALTANEIPHGMLRSFLVSAVERIAAIDRALDALQRQPGERAYLREVCAEFHRIAGAAASYGFAPLSDAASHAETECRAVESMPDPEMLHRWRELLQEMRRHLAAAGAETATAGKAGSRLVRLLCIGTVPAIETSLRLLDADSAFAIEFADELPEDAAPDVLVVQAGDAGFAAIEALRSNIGGRRTAVVMVTAGGLAGNDVARAVRAGVDELLTEAAGDAAVLGKVRALVDRKFGPPPRVLCIGIEQHASSFASVIQSAGYAVRVAASMDGAEIDFDTFGPDLVLAGIGDDADASLALVRAVHLRAPAPAPPVLLVAANAGRDLQLLAARAGAADLLPLPISRGLLLAAIQNRIAAAHANKSALQRDPLTGCLSETYFRDRLQHRVLSTPHDSSLTLALLEAKDSSARLLVAISDLLRRRLRETDEIARYGATRFAVLMTGITEDTARALFARLCEENQAGTGQPFQTAIVPQGQYDNAARWLAAAGEALRACSPSSGAVRLPLVRPASVRA